MPSICNVCMFAVRILLLFTVKMLSIKQLFYNFVIITILIIVDSSLWHLKANISKRLVSVVEVQMELLSTYTSNTLACNCPLSSSVLNRKFRLSFEFYWPSSLQGKGLAEFRPAYRSFKKNKNRQQTSIYYRLDLIIRIR